MTPDQVTAALDALKRTEQDRAAALSVVTENHSDHADRAISQLATLKLMNESLPTETLAALKEVAMSGSPL